MNGLARVDFVPGMGQEVTVSLPEHRTVCAMQLTLHTVYAMLTVGTFFSKGNSHSKPEGLF